MEHFSCRRRDRLAAALEQRMIARLAPGFRLRETDDIRDNSTLISNRGPITSTLRRLPNRTIPGRTESCGTQVSGDHDLTDSLRDSDQVVAKLVPHGPPFDSPPSRRTGEPEGSLMAGPFRLRYSDLNDLATASIASSVDASGGSPPAIS